MDGGLCFPLISDVGPLELAVASAEETTHLSLYENSITAGAQARSRPLEVFVYAMSLDGSDGYLVKVSVVAKRLL